MFTKSSAAVLSHVGKEWLACDRKPHLIIATTAFIPTTEPIYYAKKTMHLDRLSSDSYQI